LYDEKEDEEDRETHIQLARQFHIVQECSCSYNYIYFVFKLQPHINCNTPQQIPSFHTIFLLSSSSLTYILCF